MNISYRTRRRLQKIGAALLVIVILAVLSWLCWIVWLERYVIYTREGASIDFSLGKLTPGVMASPPSMDDSVEIYFNEGSNTMDTSQELTQFKGYYIDRDTLATELAYCREKLGSLESGTAIMVDLKNIDGTFNYPSGLSEAAYSNVDTAAVRSFISDLNAGKFYTIARLSSFRDFTYGLNHTSAGLSHADWGTGYLWKDEGGCYWLDPTSPEALNWIISVIDEVKGMGFNEIVLDEFRIPSTDKIIFSKDKNEALLNAMNTILERCGSDGFIISFVVSDPAFALPDGRTRLYLKGISADQVGAKVSLVTITDPENRLVFIAETNDTRYDTYSVLRPIAASDVLEEMGQ